jgi:novobiocin biosynthesis protein NovU/D-mycarose 3-C-methyltransferase
LRAAAVPSPGSYYRRTTCRICNSAELNVFADFGATPLANSFRPAAAAAAGDPRFPLACAYCGNCGLVQLPGVVDPRILFKHYRYFSSASEPMVVHLRRQAELIRRRYLDDAGCLICEIGSNDGTFLQNLVDKCRVVGVDPADNVGAAAALRGVTTINRFFTPRTARSVRKSFGRAKVIFAANCFAHVDDVDGMMRAVVDLLRDDGVFIFENHRFVHMLRSTCFDQIYHEHLSYYTLRPLEQLLRRFGMRVFDVRLVPTQGESFQIHCAKIASTYRERPSVERVRREENHLGLEKAETYQNLTRAIARRRDELRSLLVDLKSRGKRIVGYGAPGKATMLLNAMRLDDGVIDYAVDSTPIKQGCVIPGTGIAILPPEALDSDSPDYLLLLAWNYADTILEKEAPLRRRGVKFIVPIPDPRIL